MNHVRGRGWGSARPGTLLNVLSDPGQRGQKAECCPLPIQRRSIPTPDIPGAQAEAPTPLLLISERGQSQEAFP